MHLLLTELVVQRPQLTLLYRAAADAAHRRVGPAGEMVPQCAMFIARWRPTGGAGGAGGAGATAAAAIALQL